MFWQQSPIMWLQNLEVQTSTQAASEAQTVHSGSGGSSDTQQNQSFEILVRGEIHLSCRSYEVLVRNECAKDVLFPHRLRCDGYFQGLAYSMGNTNTL